MEKFWKDLRDQAIKIINYEKKKIIPLTDDEEKSYETQKICCICEKRFCTDKNDEKEFKLKQKVKVIVITQENLEELPIVFVIYLTKHQEIFQ